MLAHGCCKKLVKGMNVIPWNVAQDIRMRSMKARFLVVVDVEHDSPRWSVLCKMFHHLQQSDDPHRVVCRAGCSRDRVIVSREQITARFAISGVGALYFDEDVVSFLVDATRLRGKETCGPRCIRNDVVIKCDVGVA